MKLLIECVIREANSFSSGSGLYQFDDLYGSGPVTMIWHDSRLIFEKDVEISDQALNAIKDANRAIAGDSSTEAAGKWVASVYKGNIKKELYKKFKLFMPVVQRVCGELKVVFNASPGAIMVIDRVFILDDAGVAHPTHAPLQGSGNITATLKINHEHLTEFVAGINGFKSHLYAFTVLGNTSYQTDLSLKVVELAIAAELGIKEFYSRKLPDLEKMLATMPSPPIAQMYGSMFESYFGVKFTHAAALEKLIRKRNDVAHSAKLPRLTYDDVVVFSKVVQESLCILQTMLVGGESEMMRNLSDIGSIENRWPNNAVPKLTKSQAEKTQNLVAFIEAKIPVISVFTTPE